MGFQLSNSEFNNILGHWSKEYVVFGPKNFELEGTFSDTDEVRYGRIQQVEDLVFGQKSLFSYKETLLPISQTLFHFTEDQVTEAPMNQQKLLVILRSCDLHGVKRLDEIYLNNGFEDLYYKTFRENAKFIVMGCPESFDNCFCVSMGTNSCTDYNAYLHQTEQGIALEITDPVLLNGLDLPAGPEVERQFVRANPIQVEIPEKLDLRVVYSDMWEEYSVRCIGCGRCNFVCPTCTCYSMQDVAYKDNPKCGERRRVWASCEVDGFTDMAGGHSFRQPKGQRMRFKVLHKVYDFKKRFGYHMCVGCGRCDDVCPEYISFSNSVNKLNKAVEGME